MRRLGRGVSQRLRELGMPRRLGRICNKLRRLGEFGRRLGRLDKRSRKFGDRLLRKLYKRLLRKPNLTRRRPGKRLRIFDESLPRNLDLTGRKLDLRRRRLRLRRHRARLNIVRRGMRDRPRRVGTLGSWREGPL